MDTAAPSDDRHDEALESQSQEPDVKARKKKKKVWES